MRLTATKASLLAIGLGALRVLGAQSADHDLPLGVRSLAGVTLNRDSAASIRAKLGSTRERRVGIGDDGYISWCYVSEGSPRVLLELMSDASDMATPGQALNVIRLRANAPSEDRVGCASLRTAAALSTPAGLRLGLDQTRIEALLGRPTRSGPDSLTYAFDAKQYMRRGTPEYEAWDTPEQREACFDAGPPYANVGATLIVVLRDARAVEIRIERYDQSVC
jgi:hypothetical protein